MTTPVPTDSLARLHRDLGFKRLSPGWAKFEIVLGLVGIAAGLFGGVYFASRPGVTDIPVYFLPFPFLAFALGGYLALAGHRSLLYQSSNRLAAHLAELIRRHNPTAPESSP